MKPYVRYENQGKTRFKLLLLVSIFLIAIPILSIDLPIENKFDWDGTTMTAYDGLKYRPKAAGHVTVRDYNNEWLEHFGFGITGTHEGVNKTWVVGNFSWDWTITNITENSSFAGYLMTGENNDGDFNWTIKLSFYNDSRNMKVTHVVTNNLGSMLTNGEFWYLSTIDETKNITLNGTSMSLADDYHGEDMTDIYPEIEFYDAFVFYYQDLIDNNYRIDDIIIEDGFMGINPTQRVLAVGIGKGSGNFPNGATHTIDPEINVYQDEKMINYDFDVGHMNVSISVNNSILDLEVFTKEDGYKFAANHTTMNETDKARFDARIDSTHEMELFIIANRMDNGTINFTYPEFCVILPNGVTTVDRHCQSFEDVCSFDYANCTWSLSADGKLGWVNATSGRYYDPTITSLPNSTGSAAWRADVAFSRPPGAHEFAVETSYSSAELDVISADDANSDNSNTDFAGHRIKYNINVDLENINSINSTMDVECYSDSDICAMYVWNYTSSDWVYLVNHTAGAKQEISHVFDNTTNFSQIINNSEMFILVQTDDTFDFGISDVDLYYAHLEINYSGTPDVTSITPDNNFENLSASMQINFSCNASDEGGALTNLSLMLSDVTGDTRYINQTTDVSGFYNESSWLVNLTGGEYTWNCEAYNSGGKTADSDPRFLFIGKVIYNCDQREFSKSNINYTVMRNTSYNDADPCINILADNVTIDMNGYAIDGQNDHNGDGIRIDGFNNTLIHNGTIYDYLYNIRILNSKNNIFRDIIIGEPLVNSIYLENSTNNVFENVFYMTSQTTHVDFLRYINSDNNNVTGFNFSTDDEIITLDNSDNNRFQDGSIEQTGGGYDIQLLNGAINNVFVNVTFNDSNVDVPAGTNFTKKWWYRAYVNDTDGNAVDAATVTATKNDSVIDFSALTDVTGWIDRQEITDYLNDAGTIYYYNNYTLTASKGGYNSSSHSFNVTLEENKLDDFFTLTLLPTFYQSWIIIKDNHQLAFTDGKLKMEAGYQT